MDFTQNFTHYLRARREARDLIRQLNITELPINIFEVIKNLDVEMFLYSEIEKMAISTGRKLYSKQNAFVCKKEGVYYIAYDDKSIFQKIRFTLAHEVGHIRLKHLENFGFTTHKKKDPIEREADTFASEFIRAPVLMYLMGAESAQEIKKICNITAQSSLICERQLNDLKKKDINEICKEEIDFYSKQFCAFIEKYIKNDFF